jgi:uncharacterized protein YjdB
VPKNAPTIGRLMAIVMVATGVYIDAGCLGGAKDQSPTAPGAPRVLSVTVTPPAVTLPIGQSQLLAVAVVADVGANRTVTWISSDPLIASVDQGGTVTARAAGVAIITAASRADPAVKGTTTVTVPPPTI